MNTTPKVVLSTDGGYDVSAWPNSTVATSVDDIRRMKESSGGAVVAFGGVHTVRSLVTADLVDEYWLKVNAVVVGRGGSIFTDVTERRPLKLRSSKSFSSGTIFAIYST